MQEYPPLPLESNLPTSDYFVLKNIGEGVWMAESTSMSTRANAAIVALGDSVLIFDTFFTPFAAEDLRDAAERLTRRPVRYVINSHFHADHVFGNSIFDGSTQIVSTRRTRELIEEHITTRIKGLRSQKTQMEQELRELRGQRERSLHPEGPIGLQEDIHFREMLLKALPHLQLRLPNWTFEQQMVIHGSERSVELLTFGLGHTESDAILVIRDANIAFIGDLLFKGSHAWTGDGDPEAWLNVLDQIEAVGVRVLVPGHGPLATTTDFIEQRAALKLYMEIADGVDIPEPLFNEEDGTIEPVDFGALVSTIAIPEEITELESPHRFYKSLEALVARRAQPVE